MTVLHFGDVTWRPSSVPGQTMFGGASSRARLAKVSKPGPVAPQRSGLLSGSRRGNDRGTTNSEPNGERPQSRSTPQAGRPERVRGILHRLVRHLSAVGSAPTCDDLLQFGPVDERGPAR